MFCFHKKIMKLLPHWNIVLQEISICILRPWPLILDSRISHIFYPMEPRTGSFTNSLIGLYTEI